MTSADVPSEKQLLRRTMQARLRSVSLEECRRAGSSIAELVERSGVWTALSTMAAFASKPDEVDSGPLVASAVRAGKRVCFPRTTEAGGLEFVAVEDPSELRSGRFGVREPGPDLPGVPLDGDTLVVVPGLAFDRQGGRLGRGRGYYDRALAALRHREARPLLVGIGYAFQVVERVPMTPLDVRLDGVVSEEGLCECEASRGRWGAIRAMNREMGRE